VLRLTSLMAGSRALRASLVAAPLVAAALVVTGCRSGNATDIPPPPIKNPLGDGSPISSKLLGTCLSGVCGGNGEACSSNTDCPGFFGPDQGWDTSSNINSTNCNYPADLNEYVSGVTVTAVDTFDEDGNGSIGTIYVQDTIGDNTDASAIPVYAGTSVFDPTFSPPDLRLEPGNVVDITGPYEEFAGPSTYIFPDCITLPQMSGAIAFRFDGHVPPPVVIEPSDLATQEGARAYLSMLVTVKGVEIGTAGSESSGRYTATVSVPGTQWQISDELWDVGHLCPLGQGKTFNSVTGLVTYFGSYHVAPRSGADFDPPCGPMPDGGTGG
jgi:hypothetical protein